MDLPILPLLPALQWLEGVQDLCLAVAILCASASVLVWVVMLVFWVFSWEAVRVSAICMGIALAFAIFGVYLMLAGLAYAILWPIWGFGILPWVENRKMNRGKK